MRSKQLSEQELTQVVGGAAAPVPPTLEDPIPRCRPPGPRGPFGVKGPRPAPTPGALLR
jgi:bacteriocin-like protein